MGGRNVLHRLLRRVISSGSHAHLSATKGRSLAMIAGLSTAAVQTARPQEPGNDPIMSASARKQEMARRDENDSGPNNLSSGSGVLAPAIDNGFTDLAHGSGGRLYE